MQVINYVSYITFSTVTKSTIMIIKFELFSIVYLLSILNIGQVQVREENVHTKAALSNISELSLFYQQPDRLRRFILNINPHFNPSKTENAGAFESSFAKYLETPSTKNEAEVAVFIRINRRTESLRQNFLKTQLPEFKSKSKNLQTTHLVAKITYGADIICLLRKPIDRLCETKAVVEENIYLAAKSYLEQIVEPTDSNQINSSIPFELEDVSCTILSTLGDVQPKENSFPSFSLWLQDVLNTDKHWRPMEIVLRPLSIKIESTLQSEKTERIKIEKERNEIIWDWIVKKSRRLLLSVNQILPLKKSLTQYVNLLAPLDEKLKSMKNKELEEIQQVSQLLTNMKDWLIKRRNEITIICSLLEGAQHLKMVDLEKMKTRTLNNSEKSAKVFVLTVNYIKDPLMEQLQDWVIHLLTPTLPVFPVVSAEKTRMEQLRKELNLFVDEARLNNNLDYQIALALASSSLNDCENMTVEKAIPLLKKRPPTNNTEQGRVSSRPPTESKDNKSNNQEIKELKHGQNKENNNNFPLTNETHPSNIAEYFVQNSNLIQKGEPNIYLLNVRQHSVGEDFRWFNIGPTEGAAKPHKIIILMGATGSGKSTLINGMVNYILGVKWTDPHRFKCVREDEPVNRNQTHSQTSSVTAYTIHHREGMAVPYSITLIDTPGYGDTRGVARDKKNTENIHRFLTQKNTKIDKIHAVCFVAVSGDSRLTVTQRYILDSVLSTFGKDFQDNIRLLVTFADNADPPVVEACRIANFPSAGIAYSKFNSSVLYSSKPQQGKGNFDELFWDMGQENFTKFFKMLEGMDGKDLISTREVIQQRQLLQHSLKDIEIELENCFVTIENMDMFIERMKQYDRMMDTNKNCEIEKTVTRQTKVVCEKGSNAYNCLKCNMTCANGSNVELPEKNCVKCKCPHSQHEVENFEWRPINEKIKTTLLDMKAEYEANIGKMTTEQFVEKCVEDLKTAKSKVIGLLNQVDISARLLDSKAMRTNVLTPADYLSLMRNRVSEEQAPGYLTRLETLNELQHMLIAQTPGRTRPLPPNKRTRESTVTK